MLRKIFNGLLVLILVFGIFSVAATTSLVSGPFSFLSGLFFAEKITPDVIRAQYANSTLKVLVVPGHEQFTAGTEFKDISERDLVLQLGKYLEQEFAQDSHLSSQLVRDGTGDFAPWFKKYMAENNIDVQVFRAQAKVNTLTGVAKGLYTEKTVVDHNSAPNATALVLYGINKYANENNINLVLHLHMNDYPGRKLNKAGKYEGFAIYIPEGQLPNARASREMATTIATDLSRVEPASNFAKEKPGVVEDQELIAVGSNGTRDGVSLLIEYGYIYEKKFTNSDLRDQALKDLAHATYLGIEDYFNQKLTLSTAR